MVKRGPVEGGKQSILKDKSDSVETLAGGKETSRTMGVRVRKRDGKRNPRRVSCLGSSCVLG